MKLDQWVSMPSTPRIEPDDFPNNVTQEVLNLWTRKALPRGGCPCRRIVFTIKSHDQGWGGPPRCRGTYKGSSTWFDVGLETVSAIDSNLPSFTMTSRGSSSDAPRDSHTEQALGDILEDYRDLTPRFYISDPQSTSTADSIICTTRTIIPTTETRTTADEPPETQAEFHFDLDPGLDCLQRNKTATKATTEHVITWSCDDNVMDPDSIDGKKLDEAGRGRATANGEFVRNLKVGDVVTVWGKARYGQWVNNVEEVKIEMFWAV